MFFRLLLLAFLFYLATRIFSSIFKSESKIAGKSQSKPLDYDDQDIQDVEFKEYDDQDKE